MDILSLSFISAAFIFFSAGLSLLLGIGQLCGRRRYFENYVLASYLFCLSVIFFQVCVIVNDVYPGHPGLLVFHATALYFMAPIVYCADYLVILPVESMPRKMALLFLPVGIGLAADLCYIAMPDAARAALLAGLFAGSSDGPVVAARLVIAGAGVQMLAYLAFLFRKMATTRVKGENIMIFYLMISSVVVVAGLAVIIILGYLLGSYTLLRWGTNLTGLLVICAYLASQRFPKILQLLMFEAEKRHAARPLLGQLDVDALIARLGVLMDSECLYADDQLTLRDLADELSITPHQLSQLLNERLHTGFSAFINRRRIEEAKRLLLEEPGKTVLVISMEVGFNSKSAFYEAFLKFTGMTPQVFRKRGGGG